MENISRRQFLIGGGLLGAAALGSMGLTGCAPAQPAASAQSESGGKNLANTSSQLVEVNESDVSATEDCDIVVCGSGSAGTYAAVRAAELGASVIWLEKTTNKGGTSTVTEGINAPNTQEQIAAGAVTDIDEEVRSFMASHNWGAYEPGIRAYLENAGEAIDWAIGHGAKLMGNGSMYSCFDENGSWINMGKGMLEPLWSYGETLSSLDFRLETPAVNLVIEDGKVAGVYAQSSDGAITRINAKAVVLATGGFGSNEAMKQERMRVPSDRVKFLGFDGQDGDGINMALKAGAASQAPSALMFGLSEIAGESWDSILTIFTQWPPSWRAPQEVGKVLPMVNEKGRRFYNETQVEDCDTSRLNCAIASQKAVYTLFDENHVRTYEGFDEFDYFTGIGTGELRSAIEKNDNVVKADTIEELAAAAGIDASALTKTVADYNAMIESGVADVYGADVANLTPLAQPPFYAARVEACAYSTCGGVRGDIHAQAVDTDERPIPGLYVCGLDNGSLYFNDYPYGSHGGSGQANACTTGFVAAKAACEECGIA